jgi:hypothetical protein
MGKWNFYRRKFLFIINLSLGFKTRDIIPTKQSSFILNFTWIYVELYWDLFFSVNSFFY